MKLNPDFVTSLSAFLNEDIGVFGRSLWFEDNLLKVYARRTNQYLGQKPKMDRYETLVVANVVVWPDCQKQGLYNQLLILFEECASARNRALCIENVSDPNHFAIYERRGYTKINISSLEGDEAFWFIKLPGEVNGNGTRISN